MYKKSTLLKTNSAILATLVTSFWISTYSEDNIVLAAVLAPPTINNVEGNIATDTFITIHGSNFTSKLNASPLFWWKADMGKTPSSLGRKTAWDSSYFNGEITQAIVATGSQQAIRWDLGMSEAPALAEIVFGNTKTTLFVHRKFYEDFDVVKDVAIRTRVTGLPSCPAAGAPGVLLPGDLITGVDSGATGIVARFFQEGAHCAIYYNNQDGSINADPPVDFVWNETMTGPNGITMTNEEGSAEFPTGTSRSFNNKIIRFWSATNNNIYIGPQGLHGPHYNIVPERTGTTLENKFFTNPLTQIHNQWVTEEYVYQASSGIGTADARWEYYQNGVIASDINFISRDADNPEPYDSVFQHQVSNGAQPGSYIYYDSIYLDDSWHRVVICADSTWNNCKKSEIQIPTSWNDNEITVQLNLGGLDPKKPLFLYVINQNGVPNVDGWPFCPKCPRPPPTVTHQ